MNYGEIFSRAARLIWKHKILWVFGLLASCASGSSGSNWLSYNFNSGDYQWEPGSLPAPLENFIYQLAQFVRQTPAWFFVVAAALVCGVGLVFWLVGILGRTGLARAAWRADSGEETLSLSAILSESWRPFWHAAGASVLVGVPGFAVALVFALLWAGGMAAGFAQRAPATGLLLLCLGLPMMCLFVPFFWLLGIWGDLAVVAIANEGLGVLEGLRRAWRLLTRRFGSVVLVAVLAFVAQILFGIVVGLISAPMALGAVLGGVLTRNSAGLGLGLVLLALLVMVPVSLFLSAVFQSYLGTVWALTFRRLTAVETPPPPAPLPVTDIPGPLPYDTPAP